MSRDEASDPAMMALVRLCRPRFVLDELFGRGVPLEGEIGALAADGVAEPLLLGSVGGERRSPDWYEDAETKLSSVDIVSDLFGVYTIAIAFDL